MEDNEISVSRIYKLDPDSKLKAFADVSFSGIVIKGLSVVDGANGLFVGDLAADRLVAQHAGVEVEEVHDEAAFAGIKK